MAYLRVAKVKSRIKGLWLSTWLEKNVYGRKGDRCSEGHENDKKERTKMDDIVVEHIPESLKAPEGTWVPGGGIEIPCVYKIFSGKINKNQGCSQIVNITSVIHGLCVIPMYV